MHNKLSDQIKEYEDYRARQSEEVQRLQDRMNTLVKSREENARIVASDNSNNEARMRLDNNDRDIADLKQSMATLNRKIANDIRSLRSRVLEAQEKALSDLDSRLKRFHFEQAELKNTLIPEAEKHVVRLKERLLETQDEIQHALKEIEEINQLNLADLFQNVESI